MQLKTNELNLDTVLALKQLSISPNLPPNNFHTLHFKTDGNLYSTNSLGIEKPIGVNGALIVEYSNATSLSAVINKLYLVENTNTIILPTSPVNGSIIGISDYKSQFETNSLTITPGAGDTIAQLSTLVLDTNNACIKLAYWNNNWTILSVDNFHNVGGLTYFTDSLKTTAPFLPSLSNTSLIANHTADNISINLAPKNAGSFYLGPVADNTEVGGNLRGDYSVDLQLLRATANQITAGVGSFSAGWNNTVDGIAAVGLGLNNIVRERGSVALGDSNEVIQSSSVAIGEGNTVVGYSSVALGSYNYNMSDNYGITIGDSCETYADYSCVLQGGTDKGRVGALVFNSSSGRAQVSQFVQIGATNNGDIFGFSINPTARLKTSRYSYPDAERMCLIPDNNIYAIHARVIGSSNLGKYKYLTIEALVKREIGAASTVLIGSPYVQVVGASDDTSDWTATITVDNVIGAAVVQVNTPTVESYEAISWSTDLRILESPGVTTLNGQSFTVAQPKTQLVANTSTGLILRTGDSDPLSLGPEYDDVLEVGAYNLTQLEIIRGLSEIDVSSIKQLAIDDPDRYSYLNANLYFSLFKQGGVRPSNDNPFAGTIEVWVYEGDGAEDINDFRKYPSNVLPSPYDKIGEILLTGTEDPATWKAVFDVKNFITGLFLSTSSTSLGILLRYTGELAETCTTGTCPAVTFNKVKLVLN
jgi:hypothetical protein